MNGNPHPRVLIIGLDGATFDLIKPWAAEGRLPTLQRLMQEGAWGTLKVELPPGTVPNWPSFATGKNPGKHGIIWWLKRDPQTADFSIISSADLRGQTLWDIASDYGLPVGVVNFPLGYPPHPINGFMISGLLTPQTATDFTYPAALREELEANIGPYRIFPQVLNSRGNEAAYLEELHCTLDGRLQATRYLMQHKPWNLFFVLFGATDWVMHAFWKYHDPSHPYHDPAAAQRLGHAIRSIYEHADQAVGELLKLVDDHTTVILMSDHGSGPAVGRSMLNTWLLNSGLLQIKRNPVSQLKLLTFRLGFTPAALLPWAVRLKLLNTKVKRKLDPSRTGKKNPLRRIFLSYNDVDWPRTKAFTMGGMGQIFINVQGNHANGCVAPGREYEELCQFIVEKVKEIKLPGSDQPYVQHAYRRHELYWGEHADVMPDILLYPTDMAYLDSGVDFFSNRLFFSTGFISGGHRTNGIFFLRGPSVRPGLELRDVTIRDLAPTALHLLGLPVPEDMDGRVVSEALNEQFVKSHPIQRVMVSGNGQQRNGQGYATTADEAQIRARLASLGYLN
ncbi:MAG: alkaline phosphatase family protein [Chloroflexota bacterium]